MKNKIITLTLSLCLLVLLKSNAQTGSYSQTLPNLQSVYQSTQVTFTNTPPNATSGTLSCSWLGCQDVGISNPTFYAFIWVNANWLQIASHNAASNCGFVSFSTNVSAQVLNDAIALGGGTILMRVYVADGCPAGWGCSCCNDPYVNSLTLAYNYSNAFFNANNTTICPGQTVTYTDTSATTATSRTWYFPGGTPATSTNASPTITYNTPGTYDVSLVRVSAAGTDSSAKKTYINVQTLPTATATPNGSTTVCSGGSVSISANTGAGLSYQWQKGGSNIAGANSANYSATATGTYKVIVTGSNTCTAGSPGVNVTVNGKPTAVLSANGPVTFCPGGSVALSASTGAGFSYVWKKGSAVLSGATTSTYTATATGNYKVTITNLNGCSKTSNTVAVTVNTPTATATAQGATTVCNGGGVTINANTGTGLTYQWKKGSSLIAGATNPTYTAYTGGTYKVSVTNSCGTATSNGIAVTVNPIPSAAITAGGATVFCTGSSVVLSANTGTGLTYQWKKNGADLAGFTTSTYNASVTGTYTVIVTNSYGCTASSNAIVVTVNSTSASVTANGPTTICNGDSVMLAANVGASLTYQWLKNNVSISGATFATYSVHTAGSYKVIVTNTATGCAKTSGSVTVVVNCRLAAALNNEIATEVVPNPFTSTAVIKLENSEAIPVAVTVFSDKGNMVEKFETTAGKKEITLGSTWAKGIYMVKLKQGAKEKTIRVVKN